MSVVGIVRVGLGCYIQRFVLFDSNNGLRLESVPMEIAIRVGALFDLNLVFLV